MFLMGELVGVALIGNRRSPGGDGGNTAMMRGASWVIDPLNATVDEFVAEGFTHIQCYCPRCRTTRLRPISWLPRISLWDSPSQLSARLRCAECGGPLHSVKTWRLEDVLGKPFVLRW